MRPPGYRCHFNDHERIAELEGELEPFRGKASGKPTGCPWLYDGVEHAPHHAALHTLVSEKDNRIAELEAELAELKAWKDEADEAYEHEDYFEMKARAEKAEAEVERLRACDCGHLPASHLGGAHQNIACGHLIEKISRKERDQSLSARKATPKLAAVNPAACPRCGQRKPGWHWDHSWNPDMGDIPAARKERDG